jgi:DNA-binding IclR family transcriptional regulator
VQRSGRDARRARVLDVLNAEPALTHAELAERSGLPSRLLAQVLWAMEDDGLVVHEGRRWYAAPATEC